jgi:hypothetical protein
MKSETMRRSSPIEVTLDSTGRSGEQNKAIFVFINDPSNPR